MDLRLAVFTLACVSASGLIACGGDSGQHGQGSGGATASSGSGKATGSGAGTPGSLALFKAAEPWTQAVDADPKSPKSDAITGWLASNGGWGTGSMRIDFSINVLSGDASTPLKTFNTTSDFYTPDCDHVPFPVPPDGAIEGEKGYVCTMDGDCHFLVVYAPTNTLYEMWRANIQGSTFNGGCTAVWDLTKAYPPNLRGDQCTSADAGGFPISAMLFSADEIAAGSIEHAIRFILPNQEIRNGVYAHPGTHSTNATSGGTDAPPYGVRMRLRAGFDLTTLPSDGARVVAKALQKYGMLLADGGNIALTAANDEFTKHKWADVGVDSFALTKIQPSDMEVVDMDDLVPYTADCKRNPM